MQRRMGRERHYDFIVRNGKIMRGGKKKKRHLQNETSPMMAVEGDEYWEKRRTIRLNIYTIYNIYTYIYIIHITPDYIRELI